MKAKLSIALAILLLFASGFAQAAGTVLQLSGTLTAQKADGSVVVLGRHSRVEEGDTLTTERNSYALVRFTDGGSITLKPNTQIKLDRYVFDDQAPQKDSMVYSLFKGGLRVLTGLIARAPGRDDAYRLHTRTATIGVRGTFFTVDDIPPGRALPSGVYIVVLEGIVVAFNQAGIQAYQAGQFGFVSSPTALPEVLERRPPIPFTPPPGFATDRPAACVVR